MPTVDKQDRVLVGADRYTFEVTYVVQITLATLFTPPFCLGVTCRVFRRLALIQRFRERKRVFPVGYTPSISVVIAAYNEEKVIVNTFMRCSERLSEPGDLVVDEQHKMHFGSGRAGFARTASPCLSQGEWRKATALNRGYPGSLR